MSCRRAFDVDLAAYLVEPRAAAWDDFREHWPRCADCAAEVAAWTALQARLGSAGHPDPERLLRWADGDDGLPPAERLALARHVEACPTCTDELRALARFDVAPHVEERPVAAAPTPRRSMLRRVLWNPAVAYALLLVALAPSLLDRHEEASRDVLGPPAASEPAPAAPPATPPPPAARRAAEPEPAPADRAPAARASRDAEADRRPEPKRGGRQLRAAEDDADGAGAAAPAPPPPPPPPAPAAQAPAKAAPPAERSRALGALSRRAEPEAEGRAERPFLSIELPDAAREAGVVELRVRDVGRDRELRERFAVHPDLAMLAFELPPSWRDHTTYEVEIRVPGTDVVVRRTMTVPAP